MDFSQLSVSTASIACIVITLIISIGLPVVASVFWNQKTNSGFISAALGAILFIVFAILLENILHYVVLSFFPGVIDSILSYALYGGFAAGLFEETARLVGMKVMKKRKELSRGTSIMYGIGHGGAESIIIIGLSYISNLSTAIAINNGTISSIFVEGNDEINATLYESISQLATLPPTTFLYAGIERVSAFALQVCLSYIIYRALRDSKVYLYFLAILLHAFVDSGTVLISSTNVSLTVIEALLFVFSAVLVYFISKEYKKEITNDNTGMVV